VSSADPCRRLAGAAIDLRDARFRRDVERLHLLGPRSIYELLAELGAARLLRTEIEALVARYVALDPAAVPAVGGKRMPPRPLHRVSSR